MELKIDKNVPIPKKESVLFLEMDVGDSFVYTGNPVSAVAGPKKAFERRGIPAKFVQRKQPDGTIRVWRVA